MGVFDRALLRGWRNLAFVGHYTGLESLFDEGSNKVLRYHSVGGGWYDDIPTPDFRDQLAYLDDEYEIVDLPAVLADTDSRKVALTFDDGTLDFYDNVLPVLREFDVPATVFVIAAALEEPEFTHNEEFEYEYMAPAQVAEIVGEELVSVGNHTLTHPRLADVPSSRLEEEIVAGKRRLESILDTDVSRFCYPYGSFDERAAAVVRRTHDVGVVNQGRFEPITPETDPATIPRINGANPLFEVCWDLSDTATRIGRYAAKVIQTS